jgi:tetratricopeptide (TPR) repeat protein
MRSEILGCLGNWALQKNQKDLALQYLQEATATFPNDFAALQLGNLYEKDGDTKKACELWFEALNTNNDDVRVAALEKLIPHYKDAETWRALDLSQMLNDLL